jgi:beta-galactosidase/beta-glucuronidase
MFPNGWNYPWKTDVRTEVIETEENGEFVYHITLWANEFARCLFVDTPNNQNVRFSNNYFDIEKGFRGEVVLRSKEKISVSDITIKTFADEWKD